MSVGLARRLVWSGLATSEEVAGALYAHVNERQSFLEALSSQSPALGRELETELGRGLEDNAVVTADSELMSRLPTGLCRALLAVPIGIDEETGAVRIAVADPLDSHAGSECAFHLDSPVRLVRAPLHALLECFERPRSSRRPAAVAPAYWSALARSSASPINREILSRPSDRPIPLVRIVPADGRSGNHELHGPHERSPTTIQGTGPEQTLESEYVSVQSAPRTAPGLGSDNVPRTIHGVAPGLGSDNVPRTIHGVAPGLGSENVPRTIHGVAPEAGQRVPRSPVIVPRRIGNEASMRPSNEPSVRHRSEPVIALTRSKPSPAQSAGTSRATQPLASGLPGASTSPAGSPRKVPPEAFTTRPGYSSPSTAPPPPTSSQKASSRQPSPASKKRDDEPRRTLEALDQATKAQEVALELAEGLAAVAGYVVIFAARSKTFQGRVAAGKADSSKVEGIRISTESASVLKAACETSQYLGPLPRTDAHAALSELLGDPEGDVAVQPILVSGHPALVIVLSGFSSAYVATERADRLARASTRALARILRHRK